MKKYKKGEGKIKKQKYIIRGRGVKEKQKEGRGWLKRSSEVETEGDGAQHTNTERGRDETMGGGA